MKVDVKQSLKEAGITQPEVALKLGISLKSVNNKLNGKSAWWVWELEKINKLLEVRR